MAMSREYSCCSTVLGRLSPRATVTTIARMATAPNTRVPLELVPFMALRLFQQWAECENSDGQVDDVEHREQLDPPPPGVGALAQRDLPRPGRGQQNGRDGREG